MGFHLHQDVDRLLSGAVLTAVRVRVEAPGHRANDHGGVVFISRQHTFAVHLEGVFDHAEQAFFLILAVDIPTGIEDFVPAVLRVGLGKHHQLNVVRVAP